MNQVRRYFSIIQYLTTKFEQVAPPGLAASSKGMGLSSGALHRYRIIEAVLNEKRASTTSMSGLPGVPRNPSSPTRITSPGGNPMLAIQNAATPRLLRTYHSKNTQTTPSVAKLATRLTVPSELEGGPFFDALTNENGSLCSTGK